MLDHYVNLVLDQAKLFQSIDGEERVSAADSSWALGQMLHSLHCAAGKLGWLSRADDDPNSPVVQRRFAVEFPECTERSEGSPSTLGSFIRVFGAEDDLAALLDHADVRRLLATQLFKKRSVLSVAGKQVVGHRRHYRVQPVTPTKDRARTAWRQARGLDYSPKAGAPCPLPYCWVPSRSTTQRMSVFVGRVDCAPADTGWANSYGLSVGGKSNSMSGYPGITLPVFAA